MRGRSVGRARRKGRLKNELKELACQAAELTAVEKLDVTTLLESLPDLRPALATYTGEELIRSL